MRKNYTQLLTGIIIGLVAGLLIAKLVFVNHKSIPAEQTSSSTLPSGAGKKEVIRTTSNNTASGTTAKGNIPATVFTVLQYIKANGHAMDNYVGGRVFSNREKILPQTGVDGGRIQYQEWDVHPKIQGQNRGTERICTGSDGRSWYTNDHYKSFTEIK